LCEFLLVLLRQMLWIVRDSRVIVIDLGELNIQTDQQQLRLTADSDSLSVRTFFCNLSHVSLSSSTVAADTQDISSADDVQLPACMLRLCCQ